MAEPNSKLTFSLAGCGFLGIYHIGVAACLRENVPHLLDEANFAGASAGALISSCLICKVSLNDCVDFAMRLARSSRQHPLGGWEPKVNIEAILRRSLELILPADAHRRCSGRLFVSCSRLTMAGLENQVFSHFTTKKDLIDVLMCSAFVPGFSAYGLPTYKGKFMFDGGLTDNLPRLGCETITISPWSGEHTICPRDPLDQTVPMTVAGTSVCPTAANLVRFKDAFLPPTQDLLKVYFWQGFDAARNFLAENDLVHCSSHRVFTHLIHVNETHAHDCQDCQSQRQHAQTTKVSSELLDHLLHEEEEAFSRGLGTLMATPMKTAVNLISIPFVMVEEQATQLYLAAYFGAKSQGYVAMVESVVRSLSSPSVLLYNLLTWLTSKAAFSALEYLARVVSVVAQAGTDVVTSTHSVAKGSCRCVKRTYDSALDAATNTLVLPLRIVCKMCGLVKILEDISTAPSPFEHPEVEVKVRAQEEFVQRRTVVNKPLQQLQRSRPNSQPSSRRNSVTSTPENVSVKPEDSLVNKNFKQIHNSRPNSRPGSRRSSVTVNPLDSSTAGLETINISSDRDLAVVLDIKVEKVNLSIPVDPEERGHGEEGEASGEGGVEIVQGAGVGPIEDVSFDSLAYAGAPGPQGEGVRESVLQGYVQRFEQYRPVATMHYVDEDNVQHTESLFVEDANAPSMPISHPHPSMPHTVSISSETSKPSPSLTAETNKEATMRSTNVVPVSVTVTEEDQEGESDGAEVEGLGVGVEAELRALLEEKVVQPQRQFERQYQQAHARRLRGAGIRTPHASGSATPTSGLYRLQVVSFTHDLAPASLSVSPSPALSRAGSARNSTLNLTAESDGSVTPTPIPTPTHAPLPFLVRSVSDASSLASSLQELRSSQADLRKRLPGKVGKVTKEEFGGGLSGAKRHSGSLQSLCDPSSSPSLPELVRRSISDTSGLAGALCKLKAEGVGDKGGTEDEKLALTTNRGQGAVRTGRDIDVNLLVDHLKAKTKDNHAELQETDVDVSYTQTKTPSSSTVSMAPQLPAILDMSSSSGSGSSDSETDQEDEGCFDRPSESSEDEGLGEQGASCSFEMPALSDSAEAHLERSASGLRFEGGKKSVLTSLKKLKNNSNNK